MLRSIALMALVAATSVWAADEVECSLDKKCPESAPCCGRMYSPFHNDPADLVRLTCL
jgi:hypothetical protein